MIKQALGAAAVMLTLAATPVLAQSDERCTALSALALGNVRVTSAAVVPAGQAVPGAMMPAYPGMGGGGPVSGLPAMCRVTGSISPEAGSDIRFEVWMPQSGWNGRYFGVGNGGLAGSISYPDLVPALRAGYATASTDTGHADDPFSAAWARGNRAKVRDYGWRGVHLTTVTAKRIVVSFYGRAASKNYFMACSNGGRQALMEASRFPEDFDGIIAGAPAAQLTKVISSMIWTQQAQMPPGAALRHSQAKFLQREVLRQCDSRDGVADGLIDDPRQCRFDTARLACGTSSSDQCFAPQQMTALNRILRGPPFSRALAPGMTFPLSGAEAGNPVPFLGWEGWIMSGGDQPPAHAAFPRAVLSDLVSVPFTDTAGFDWKRHPAMLSADLSADLDAQPDMRRYFARGGKLMIWHGWADAAIAPQHTIDFYNGIVRRSGRMAQQSARLFMVPGAQHCGGGTGASSFGQMFAPSPNDKPEDHIAMAMQHWVEQGRSPESVIGRMGFPGQPVTDATKQRLHCAWPKRAVLTKGADPDRAASYSCRGGTRS